MQAGHGRQRPRKNKPVSPTPPQDHNDTNVHCSTDDIVMSALEKQLQKSKKASSKKDQEIAQLKAQLEDRADERRARFPNGSPANSDVESEDEIGANAADSVTAILLTRFLWAHHSGSRLCLYVSIPRRAPVNNVGFDKRAAAATNQGLRRTGQDFRNTPTM